MVEHMKRYSDEEKPYAVETCEIVCVDADRVQRAAAAIPDSRELAAQAESFRLLGEPNRLRILHALAAEELCVCDLSALLGASQSAVSHQLRLLRSAGLVRYRKAGKMVYYALDHPRVRSLLQKTAGSEVAPVG